MTVPVRDYAARGPDEGGAPFLWVHGGAFVSGGLDQVESDAVARALAERGRRVRTVAYRLAPRMPVRTSASSRPHPNRFPGPLDDVIEALLGLQESTGSPAMIGGASAGASLAAAALVRLRDRGATLPLAAAFVYGSFHAELPEPSQETRGRTSGLRALTTYRPWMVRRMNLNFAGSRAAMRDPHAFAGGGALGGLPPTLVLDADRDSLRASGESFAVELAAAGVEVRRAVVPDSRHGFFDRPRGTAFAHGIDAVDSWLRAHKNWTPSNDL